MANGSLGAHTYAHTYTYAHTHKQLRTCDSCIKSSRISVRDIINVKLIVNLFKSGRFMCVRDDIFMFYRLHNVQRLRQLRRFVRV